MTTTAATPHSTDGAVAGDSDSAPRRGATERGAAPFDESEPAQGNPGSLRRFVAPAVATLAIAVAAARFLAVDVAGIVMNDSLGYLRRSSDPFESGFVVQGYRQVAYPALMWISNLIGGVFGWDRIFGMALAERALLAVAIAVTIWAMRWWSVPLVVLFTSAPYVLHADFLLPEGILLPMTVLCGAALAAIVMHRVRTMMSARLALAAMVGVAVLSAAIKLQYAALLIVAAGGAWLLRKDRLVTRRFVVTAFGVSLAVVGSLALFQSIENRHERGVFEPISERSWAAWYGAWVAIFEVDSDRADDPALAEWYDEGNLHVYFEQARETYPDYRDRSKDLYRRIDDMFHAAGTSATKEKVAAFIGALSGGRSDDIGTETDAILAAEPGDPLVRLSFNRLGRSDRLDDLIQEANEGLQPGFVTFGPLFNATQDVAGDYRDTRGLIAWSSIAAMLLSLIVRGRHRPAAVTIVGATLVVAVALASGYIDNARYLLGPLSLVAFGGTLAVRALCHTARRVRGRVGAPPPVSPALGQLIEG